MPSVALAVQQSDAISHPADRVALAGVRRMRSEDIADICTLFAEIFRAGRIIRRDELARCLEETYLGAPEDRERPASLVDVGSDGRVQGFMGIITVGARLGNERLRGGILGNFMAREGDRAKIGLRLARATTTSDLDFLFTDTASKQSLGVARALGFQTLPIQSLEWMKVFRPCRAATRLLGSRIGVLGSVLAPFAWGADLIATRLPATRVLDQARQAVVDRRIDPAAFVARAPALVARYRLRPEWEREDLTWLLDQAGRKTSDGPLHLREVTSRDGRTLGLYVLYAAPGGIAQVLQVLAARCGGEDIVLTALLRYAREIGAVAVRGGASPQIIEGLMRHPGIIYRHVTSSTLFTRRRDLADAIATSDVMLGGLLGEGWTRLVADDFS